MNIVKLEKHNLRDVPESLRHLADLIELEESVIHAIVITVDINGEINIHGYGDVGDRAHEIGILQMAMMKFAFTE